MYWRIEISFEEELNCEGIESKRQSQHTHMKASIFIVTEYLYIITQRDRQPFT